MIYLLSIAIVAIILASEFFFYKLYCHKTAQDQRVIEALLKVIADKLGEKKELSTPDESPDNKATNAERLYMEGIQSVLTYDIETVRKYFRGDDDT